MQGRRNVLKYGWRGNQRPFEWEGFAFTSDFGFASQSDQLRRPCNLIGCRQGAYGATLRSTTPTGGSMYLKMRQGNYVWDWDNFSRDWPRRIPHNFWYNFWHWCQIYYLDLGNLFLIWTYRVSHDKMYFFQIMYDVFNKWEHLLLICIIFYMVRKVHPLLWIHLVLLKMV